MALAATDPIIEWVNKEVGDGGVQSVEALNPGLFPFNDSEIRIETDNNGIFNEQQIRFGLKPIMGMTNEIRLSRQRRKVIELKKKFYASNRLLLAYLEVLNYWKLLKMQEILEESDTFFQKAQRNLHALQGDHAFDSNGFVSDLAFFAEIKSKVNSQIIGIREEFNSETKSLSSSYIKNLVFIDYPKMKTVLSSLEKKMDLTLELEVQKMSHLEFERKKREAYQVLKFISVKRDENVFRPQDFSVQLAFRLPFLSDSSELEDAKLDFYEEKIKFHTAKIEKEQSLSELYSEFQGLSEKIKILQLLPKSSFNRQKLAGSMTDLGSALKSETNFLKAKLNYLETHTQIFYCYLQILSFKGKLKDVSYNPLSQTPQLLK